MKVCVYYNLSQVSKEIAARLCDFILASGHEAGLTSELAFSGYDRILVLGGDGTMLRVARQAAETRIPLVGINYGNLGFLTEFEKEEYADAVRLVTSDHPEVVERAMLEVDLNGKTERCLNELAILRDVSPESHNSVVKISVTIDGSFAGDFSADGLIVATPTGSTAYSLSAGGSIMTPECATFLLTPVCSFSMRSRPIAYPDRCELGFVLPETKLLLYGDGVFLGKAGAGDVLTVKRSAQTVVFLTRHKSNFFRRLMQKIN